MPEVSTPLSAVVEQVAAFEEVSPEVLPPPTETLSPETVTRLTAKWVTQTESIEFTYLWYRVAISPDGEVTVTP